MGLYHVRGQPHWLPFYLLLADRKYSEVHFEEGTDLDDPDVKFVG